MAVDLEAELTGVLGDGRALTQMELDEMFAERYDAVASSIEESFAEARWYTREAPPYEPPSRRADRPLTRPPVVEAERRLWVSRYNPASLDFEESDVADDRLFPWTHPENAPADGWWLSTRARPVNRPAIEEISSGDLVVCQRTDPGPDERDGADPYTDNVLVGICVVGITESWFDAETERWERRACLVPLTKFDHPVPRTTARRRGRLRGASFSNPRQLPGRAGSRAHGLSPVEWEDAVDLLSVCGIPPEALAEPDTPVLAARLRSTSTGNEEFFKLRYDARIRDAERRKHEREAERRARNWAANHGYVLHDEAKNHVPLSGFDLLFVDADGNELEIEVKGYSASGLSAVHLQPSQAWRALDASNAIPPEWRLFAVLKASTPTPDEQVRTPKDVVDMLSTGGIKVKGGWPAPRPTR